MQALRVGMEDARLVEDDNARGIQLSRINRAPGGDSEALCTRISSTVIVMGNCGRTNGMSAMLNTTTPWCSGVSSVIFPKCALTMWFP